MEYHKSPSVTKLLERLHGKNLLQMSMCTMDEIELLLEHMAFNRSDRVLDLGVCYGRITEYLCDRTGADFTGIDIDANAISTAKILERPNLRYLVADMTALPFEAESFDKILSIDSLYFVKNREATLDSIMKLLKPGGRLGICWSQVLTTPMETELSENTEIGKWADSRGFSYTAIDRIQEHKLFWQKSMQIFSDMQTDFEADGLGEEWQGHMKEHQQMLPLVMENKNPRWLFFIENNN